MEALQGLGDSLRAYVTSGGFMLVRTLGKVPLFLFLLFIQITATYIY